MRRLIGGTLRHGVLQLAPVGRPTGGNPRLLARGLGDAGCCSSSPSPIGESTVLETFADTEIGILPKTLEIAASVPDDYRIWQRLFDVVYVKRGPPGSRSSNRSSTSSSPCTASPSPPSTSRSSPRSNATPRGSTPRKRKLETRIRHLEDV
ncbi:MAG: hypothetical protein MZW92_02505 [Comamonadaceae bacterium]|nr:hypothetical protein [Comamonadaceae bacterium]